MDSELSSPGPRTFQRNTQSPCDISQWRIQDFPEEGAPTLKEAIIWPFFPKTAWNWKNLDPQGGARPWRPPLDPPMYTSDGNVFFLLF